MILPVRSTAHYRSLDREMAYPAADRSAYVSCAFRPGFERRHRSADLLRGHGTAGRHVAERDTLVIAAVYRGHIGI
jgi:hypothetical protein